jgi:hypothetical protein
VSPAARLMLIGLVLVMAGMAAYSLFDWAMILGHNPHFVRPLKAVLRPALSLSWYVALGVPVALVLGSMYQLAVAKGGRGVILARLFAWFTLWVIGSFAFFAGMFLAYAPDLGEGGNELAAPALIAIFGYIVMGLGFAASVFRKPLIPREPR